MQDSVIPVDTIRVGDRVAHRLSTGGNGHGIMGKVIGIFNTHDRQTLADVEWESLGPPRRLQITNLTKV